MTVKLNTLNFKEIFGKATLAFNKLFELDDKKTILVILMSSIIFFLDFIFVIGWQNKRINTIRPQIKQIKADINTINDNFANIEELKKKFAIGKKEIISGGQLSILMEEISNIANKNNALIMRIQPSADQKGKKETKNKTVLTGKFTPAFIDIELSCGYHNLGSFINALENSVNFMRIQNIKIISNENDYSSHRIALLIKTYLSK